MIVTDITGKSGGDTSQVFNLLALMADPEAYRVKLKALVDATEEHKKYVESVAPVSEILAMRAQIALDKAAAAETLAGAKAESAKLKADAQAQAKILTSEAKAAVTQAKKLAAEAQAEVVAKRVEMDEVAVSLKSQLAAAEEAERVAQARAVASLEEKKLLEAEKAQVLVMKNQLIAKAKIFAAEL